MNYDRSTTIARQADDLAESSHGLDAVGGLGIDHLPSGRAWPLSPVVDDDDMADAADEKRIRVEVIEGAGTASTATRVATGPLIEHVLAGDRPTSWLSERAPRSRAASANHAAGAALVRGYTSREMSCLARRSPRSRDGSGGASGRTAHASA